MSSLIPAFALAAAAFSSFAFAGAAVLSRDTGQPNATLYGVVALALFALAGILSAYLLRKWKH